MTENKRVDVDDLNAELGKRYIERLMDNFELVDVVKESGTSKPLRGVIVDTEENVVGLVYTDETAEIIPFDEFEDNQWGMTGLNYR